MNTYTHLTEKDIDLLSAYLDGELTEREKAVVSGLLASLPDAGRKLEGMRMVQSVLHLLPIKKVPHHFTLTRQQAQAAKPGWAFNALRLASGVAMAALAVVLAYDYLMPVRALPAAKQMDSFAEEAPLAMEAAPAAAAEGELPVFTWWPAKAYGMGGGGGAAGPDGPAQPQGLILPDISLAPGKSWLTGQSRQAGKWKWKLPPLCLKITCK